MTRIAVYPGSFDPITRGHEDLIRRAFTFADKVVVAVAVNVAKQPLFTLEERVALIRQAAADPKVEVRAFDGLLADFARQVGAAVIVRGLRAVSDFEYEFQMALMNRNLAPGIETVFLVPAFDLTYLSSSLVREVAGFGGDVSQLVHPAGRQALRPKFPKCHSASACTTGRAARGNASCCPRGATRASGRRPPGSNSSGSGRSSCSRLLLPAPCSRSASDCSVRATRSGSPATPRPPPPWSIR